jgi:hypothetical protein
MHQRLNCLVYLLSVYLFSGVDFIKVQPADRSVRDVFGHLYCLAYVESVPFIPGADSVKFVFDACRPLVIDQVSGSHLC